MADPTSADRSRLHPVPLVPLADRDRHGPALPTALTSFVGREREVAAVARLLRDPAIRLVTLTGPGGVGKTRLALQVAEELEADFADGSVFVALAAVADPSLVASTVAQVLGVREAGDRSLPDRLAAALAGRELLLVLDNFEHLRPAAPFLGSLLAACPSLVALVTSRAVLNVAGEHLFPVPPLGLPSADVASADEAQRSEAVQLFVSRARAVWPDFALVDAQAADVVGVCQRLDGLPLAIELAAARVAVLPPRALLARLDRRLPLLSAGPADAPARLRTMRDAIAWSHDLLSPEEQALLRRLAVFAGGCSLAAAEAVCGDGGDVLDGIASLVGKSLLQQTEGSDDEPRYAMLETVREFALERLEASGEAAAMRARHAAYFLALAEAAEPAYGTAAEGFWLRRLDLERPNLRAALTWAVEQDAPEALLRLTPPLWWFWWVSTSSAEGHTWLERAVAATDVPPPNLRGARARLAAATGRSVLTRGDFARASELFDESLALARETGDAKALALAMTGLGFLANAQGDQDRAEAFGTEALTRWRQLAEPGWIADALYLLGFVNSVRGDQARAEAFFSDALDLARASGAVLGEAAALEALGTCARDLGEHRRAASLFGESLTLVRDGRDPLTVALCLKSLGAVAAVVGQVEQATRLFGASEALRESHGFKVEPIERERLDRAIAPARAHLSQAAFGAAWAAGRALPLEQAVVEALAVADAVTAAPEPRPAPAGLSPRECEVLKLLAADLTDQQIADELFVSRRTVNSHVASILAKLDVRSRREAAAFAMELGLV